MLPTRNSNLPYPQKISYSSHMTSSGGREAFCQILVYNVFLVKVYCFFLTRAGGVKVLYIYANIICEWCLTNKNELKFTLADPILKGAKVIIMVHQNNYCTSQQEKIYSFEIWFKHVMVIRKTGILNGQLAKGNFAIRKHYHLKLINSS